MIQTFWSGMRQEIRIRLIEWGISPEHTPLEVMVSKAINIENSEEAYRRELHNEKQAGTPEQSWGRFVNRIDGPQRWRPSEEGGGSQSKARHEKVRANAVSPQQWQHDQQTQPQEREGRRHGRRVSRVK